MNKYEVINKAVDKRSEILCGASDKIWQFSELSLEEKQSSELIANILQNEGFKVKKNLAGISTAFSAEYGSGEPKIAILGEYDALDGLSQIGGVAEKKTDPTRNGGHGCGHNLLGVGSLAAALAVKDAIDCGLAKGTVIYYGCPGEEGCASKAYMAYEGEFDSIDAALCWHPSDVNEVQSGSFQACIQIEYTFHGLAAHAAGDPENGRSALDAVELMNLGVQFLREHIPHTDCLHYAITNTGGISPNVVQAEASVLYMVRSDKVFKAKKLLERVDKIANGAAMMTETTVTRRFVDGCSDTISNSVIEKQLFKNMQKFPLPQYTREEKAFANKIFDTYEKHSLPGSFIKESAEVKQAVEKGSNFGKSALNEFLVPLYHSDTALPGSTDVGDTSYHTPTAQISAVTWTSCSPGHSWQNVALGNTSIAHKGMLYAGKVLAATAIDLMEDKQILLSAKQEFNNTVKGEVESPIEHSFGQE